MEEQGIWGSGRFGVLEFAPPRERFLQTVCEVVCADYLEFCRTGPELVKRVGIACGAAAEFLSDACAAKCDTFVTGEARFHAVLECQSLGMNLVLTGHYCSERPAVEELATQLRRLCDKVEFFASVSDQNPLNLYTARG
jgi:putative NIF3 family GTP cyclohydrolase 1 type 2